MIKLARIKPETDLTGRKVIIKKGPKRLYYAGGGDVFPIPREWVGRRGTVDGTKPLSPYTYRIMTEQGFVHHINRDELEVV
jgi:hypothetical protein